jgi:tetratricopeptide (TPR) repeat protein
MSDLIENRQIRVFISSTFRDMQAERDYLVQKVFPILRRYCEGRYVTFHDVDLRWGISEEESTQGKVVDICLKEIQKTNPFFIGLLGARYGWVPDEEERRKIDKNTNVFEEYDWVEKELKDGTSITEIEIQDGVLRAEKAGEEVNAYFYFRSETPRMEVPDDFKEKPGSREAEKLQHLKDIIRQQKPDRVMDYDDLERLGQLVEQDFKDLVDRLFPQEEIPSELERERLEQRSCLKRMTDVYVPVPESEKAIDDFVESAKRGLVITGEGGIGKSALLAHWIQNRKERWDERVVYHFIDRSGDEGDYRKVTARLIEEIKDLYKLPSMPEQSGSNANRQKEELENLLFALRDRGRLVIILDGVDKLSGDDAKELKWLPVFPDNCKFIFSTQNRWVSSLKDYPAIEVKALDVERRKVLIEQYFAMFAKELTPSRIERIAKNKESENPLALRTLLDELRMFGKHEELDAKIDEYLAANSIPELFALALERCEETFNYGTGNFVQEALSFLYVAQGGLLETEIRAFTGAAPLYWSQLFYGMASHLMVRSGKIMLSHSFIRDAVKSRYLPDDAAENEYRKKLVESVNAPDAEVSPGRKYEEMAHQLFESADWDKLHRILLDFKNLGYLGISALAEYWRALRRIDQNKYVMEQYLKLPSDGRTPVKMGDLFLKLYEVAMALGDTSSAIAFASEAIRLRPNNAVAYNARGWAYTNGQKDHDRAIADFTEAIRLSPNFASAYNNRGMVYIDDRKDYDRGIADCTDAIRLNPNFAGAYYARGTAYQYGKKDHDRAIADYTEAIRLNPNFVSAYNNRGVVYLNNRKDYDQAIMDFTEALHIDPNNTMATGNLAAAKSAKEDGSWMIRTIKKIFFGLIVLAGVSYLADGLDKGWLHSLAIIFNIAGVVWLGISIIIRLFGIFLINRIRYNLLALIVAALYFFCQAIFDIGLSVYFVMGRKVENPVSMFLQNPFEVARKRFLGTGKDDKADMQADILPPAPQGVNNTGPAAGTAGEGAKYE